MRKISHSKKRIAADRYLEELGLLTIRWANLEAYVDLIAAYLSRVQDKAPVPRTFKQRLHFIRQKAKHDVLVAMRGEIDQILNDAIHLSKRRNQVTHGVVVSWKNDTTSEVVLLKNFDGKYVAHLDREVGILELNSLNEELDRCSRLMFGLLERIKAVFRLLEGDDRFMWVSRLEGDRG